MDKNELLRALWLAVKANGGTLRVGPSTLQNYPGNKAAIIRIRTDDNFGELIITADIDPTKDS